MGPGTPVGSGERLEVMARAWDTGGGWSPCPTQSIILVGFGAQADGATPVVRVGAGGSGHTRGDMAVDKFVPTQGLANSRRKTHPRNSH